MSNSYHSSLPPLTLQQSTTIVATKGVIATTEDINNINLVKNKNYCYEQKDDECNDNNSTDWNIYQSYKRSSRSYSSSSKGTSLVSSPEYDTEMRVLSLQPLPSGIEISDEDILKQHGYRRIDKLSDTLQGELILGETIPNDVNQKRKRVAIKRISRKLHNERVIIDEEMQMVTSENVIKESIILHHLTVDNKFTQYICQFVDFFHSDTDFYLITKYIDGQQNLAQWVAMAHGYIKENRLSIATYQKFSI